MPSATVAPPRLGAACSALLLAAGLAGCYDAGYGGYSSDYSYDSGYYQPYSYGPSYGLGFGYFDDGELTAQVSRGVIHRDEGPSAASADWQSSAVYLHIDQRRAEARYGTKLGDREDRLPGEVERFGAGGLISARHLNVPLSVKVGSSSRRRE
jgi:hypothetical protein